jgi:hypothetical protein
MAFQRGLPLCLGKLDQPPTVVWLDPHREDEAAPLADAERPGAGRPRGAEANRKEGAPTPTQGNDKAVQSRSFSLFLIVSISGFLVD